MGMTIDEAIRYGVKFQAMNRFSKDASPCEFTSTALDIMFKYKKIEEIMSADFEHIHPLDRDKYIVASIKEVINHVD